MDWLVTYQTAAGLQKKVVVRAIALPNHKAVAQKIVMDAYGDEPPQPLGNLSAIDWLDRCGLEIVDIDLLNSEAAV
ncbi:hypothetical protein [Pseudomonas sp. F(2018)]|uniref:hypothetical protein n=1 Tax=Pseudomonas sp. F(2018) TaxID=2502240 RepID=UPI0010F59398|nr:hypothetical protein [Pseudomonas sp. F(2018)]